MLMEKGTDIWKCFTAKEFEKADGSITLSLNEIDLVENAGSEQEARTLLAKSILEYANEYYENYEQYSHSPNRGESYSIYL